MERTKKIALVLNIVVLIMALVGSILCFGEIYIMETKAIEHGIKLLKFFTLQSNILAGLVALAFIIFLAREQKSKKLIPKVVYLLKYIATIDLIITFLVVALFLGFIVSEGYFSLYTNANFFFHFAIPILCVISFVWFEGVPTLKLKHTFIGVAHLAVYAVFYMAVVLTHFKDGAVDIYYDWYAFAQKGILIAFISAIIVLSLGYLVSFAIYKIINKRNNALNKKM